MQILTETTRRPLAVALPADLSEWASQRDLVTWTTDWVKAMDGVSFDLDSMGKPDALRAMLILLTYCYATGKYATHEIEEGVYKDEIIRWLCFDVYPDLDDVRYFRGEYRDAIKASLVAVFKLVWPLRDENVQAGEAPARGREISPCFTLSDQELDRDFALEAKRRIATAEALDQAAAHS